MPETPLLQPTNIVGPNRSIREMLSSTLRIHSKILASNGRAPIIFGLQAYGLGNEHYWQALNENSVEQTKYTTG